MPLRINDAAFLRTEVGMPRSHAAKFMKVSRTLRVIILCRATGPHLFAIA